MLASLVQTGFLTWAFYASQPYLLDLLDSDAIWVAGLVAVGDRALDDRRQPARPGALAALRATDDPAHRRGRRRDVRGGRPRARRVVLGRADGAPARDRARSA